MKKFILSVLALMLMVAPAQAVTVNPLTNEQADLMNNHWGSIARQLQLGTAVQTGQQVAAMALPMGGNSVETGPEKILHLIWDPSSSAYFRYGTANSLGGSIPALSLITQVYMYTETAVVSNSNDATIALNCLNAGDLLAAVDPDASWGLVNGMGSGAITGIPVAGVSYVGLVVRAGCSPTFSVAVHTFASGRVHIYIKYVAIH